MRDDENGYIESGEIKGAAKSASETNFKTVRRTGVLASEKISQHRLRMNEIGQSYEEISLMDTTDPLSVASLSSPAIKDAARAIPPETWGMTLEGLIIKAGITDTEAQMRLAFWDEYALSQDQKKKMNLMNVYRISSKMYFYDNILRNPLKTAFLLTPPQKYQYKMREMLDMAHRRMREVLALPLTHRGQPNTRLIAEIVKIAILLENRVMGAVSQKLQVETKSLNVNVNTDRKSYFSVEDELRAVERQLDDLRAGGSGLLMDESAGGMNVEREISAGDHGITGAESIAFAEVEDGAGVGEAPEGAGE